VGTEAIVLIHGEGLLFWGLSSPHLDLSHGAQFLHLCYLVEHLLSSLHQRGLRFRLIFFSSFASLHTHPSLHARGLPTSSVMLARALLISHLRSLSSFYVDVDVLSSWWDPAFEQLVLKTNPSCLLVVDEDSTSSPSAREFFLGLSVKGLLLNLPLTFAHELRFRASQAKTLILNPTLPFNQAAERHFSQAFKNFYETFSTLPEPPNPSPPRSPEEFLPFLSGLEDASELDAVRLSLNMSAAACLLHEYNDRPAARRIIELILFHSLLLDLLPLKLRAQELLPFPPPSHPASKLVTLAQELISRHHSCLLASVGYQGADSPPESSFWADPFDGRLLFRLLELSCSPNSSILQMLSESHRKIFSAIWKEVASSVEASPTHLVEEPTQVEGLEEWEAFRSFVENPPKEQVARLPFAEEVFRACEKNQGLIPLRNPNVKQLFPGSEFQEDPNIGEIFSGPIFQDIYHWKSSRLLETPGFNAQETRSVYTLQKLARFYNKMAQTIGVEKEDIVVVGPQEGEHGEQGKGKGKGDKPKGGWEKQDKKGKKVVKSSADKARDKIEQEKRKKELQKEKEVTSNLKRQHPWTSTKNIEKFLENKLFYSLWKGLVLGPGQEERIIVILEAIKAALTEEPPKDPLQQPSPFLISSLLFIREVFLHPEGYSESSEIYHLLLDCLEHTKLGSKVPKTSHKAGHKAGHKAEKDPHLLRALAPPAEFQLKFLGPFLVRPKFERDPRVSFTPDPWQVKFLDAIDKNHSILASAPTSAGKTFASFYCMRKVLREGDDGLVIYVAPTKALVNQVVVDLIARFNKNYKHGGRTLHGIFTRDIRDNPFNCQILVTVPEILRILLTSHGTEEWQRRIRYIILDEVHSISDESSGLSWEHIILLSRCPLIALSATIGNVEEFASWLTEIQNLKRERGILPPTHQLDLIHHRERYSPLRYIHFNHQRAKQSLPEFNTKKSLREQLEKANVPQEVLEDYHPLAMVSFEKICRNALPRDFSTSPRDSLALYQALAKAAKEIPEGEESAYVDFQSSLSGHLNPSNYFSSSENSTGEVWLTKEAAQRYDLELIREMIQLARSPATRPLAEKAYQSLLPLEPEETRLKKVELAHLPVVRDGKSGEEAEEKEERGEESKEGEPESDASKVMRLLLTLISRRKAPALFFNFSRIQCEAWAQSISEELERLESSRGDLEELTKQNEEAERLRRKKEKESTSKKAKEKGKGKEGVELEEEENVSLMTKRIYRLFTLVPIDKELPEDEMEEFVEDLKKAKVKDWLIEALKVGVGVHHAELPVRYRQTVEILFRRGFLQAVFATGSLALGINMPCKTVVFLWDSFYLNPLMFRQMSGRAGRRGYDPDGEVLFFGIPSSKIHRLMESPIPKIRGGFPLTISLILQELILLEKNTGFLPTLEISYKVPLFSFGEKSHLSSLMEQYFRFGLDFLMRRGVLDQSLRPINVAGLISHIHYTEPSNLVMAHLLQTGVIHRYLEILKSQGANKKQVLLHMIELLSFLFCRKPLTKYHAKVLDNREGRRASKVLLPSPNKLILKAIEEYNKDMFLSYFQFCKVAAHRTAQLRKGIERLPFSNKEFYGAFDPCEPFHPHPAFQQLHSSAINAVITSPFVALSGQDDDYTSMYDGEKTVPLEYISLFAK